MRRTHGIDDGIAVITAGNLIVTVAFGNDRYRLGLRQEPLSRTRPRSKPPRLKVATGILTQLKAA